MPGSMPPTRQPDWLSSTTAMIVLFWSRATRDLLKSFGWGIAALHRLHAATKLPLLRRPPHSVYQYAEDLRHLRRAGSRSCALAGYQATRYDSLSNRSRVTRY